MGRQLLRTRATLVDYRATGMVFYRRGEKSLARPWLEKYIVSFSESRGQKVH